MSEHERTNQRLERAEKQALATARHIGDLVSLEEEAKLERLEDALYRKCRKVRWKAYRRVGIPETLPEVSGPELDERGDQWIALAAGVQREIEDARAEIREAARPEIEAAKRDLWESKKVGRRAEFIIGREVGLQTWDLRRSYLVTHRRRIEELQKREQLEALLREVLGP